MIEYEFGHPERYLTAAELDRVKRVKRKVIVTLARWTSVPQILWPIAEDLTVQTPGWLRKA